MKLRCEIQIPGQESAPVPGQGSNSLRNIKLDFKSPDQEPVILGAVGEAKTISPGPAQQKSRGATHTSSLKCCLRVSIELRDIIETSSSVSSTERDALA